MGEWISVRLGDICSKIGSGATPRGGNDVYLTEGPYSLIRSQNIYNDGFRKEGLAFIGEEHAAELDGVEVLMNDVLVNITGDSVARVCQVPPSSLPARVNQHVAIVRPDPDRMNPRFLRYALVSSAMQQRLLLWAGSGGTRNALTKGMLESLEILAPADVGEQRAIAHILGTLDDKIKLNRRMNETLEAMARALFKSWFVDFDPVRAKMEGRWRPGESLPSLPAHLYGLFPDQLVDSELGEIPEGWEICSLQDIATNPRDTVNPAQAPSALFQHFSIPAYDEGQMPKPEYGREIRSQKNVVPPEAVLLSKLNPRIERVWLADVDQDDRPACSTEFVVLVPHGGYPRSFLYSLLTSRGFQEQLQSLVTGTSGSHQRVPVRSILNMAIGQAQDVAIDIRGETMSLPDEPLPTLVVVTDYVPIEVREEFGVARVGTGEGGRWSWLRLHGLMAFHHRLMVLIWDETRLLRTGSPATRKRASGSCIRKSDIDGRRHQLGFGLVSGKTLAFQPAQGEGGTVQGVVAGAGYGLCHAFNLAA